MFLPVLFIASLVLADYSLDRFEARSGPMHHSKPAGQRLKNLAPAVQPSL